MSTMTNTHTQSTTTADSTHGASTSDERRFLGGGLGVGLAYLAGTAFMAVFFATSHPARDASPQEAAQGFHDAALMVGAGTWLAVLPLPFLLIFLGGLGPLLRRVAGGPTAVTAVAAGTSSAVMVALGALVSSLTPAIGADDTSAAAGSVVKALDAATPLAVAMSGFPRAVLLVVVTSALLRAGLHGRGMAGFAWLVAGLSLLGTLTLVTDAFFPVAAASALLFAAWVTSVAVVLRRRPVRG